MATSYPALPEPSYGNNPLQRAINRLILRLAAIPTPVFFPDPYYVGSANWNGDAKGTGDNGVIDLATEFGLPPKISRVFVKLIAASATVGRYFGVGPASGLALVAQRTAVANQNVYIGPSECPCDANGNIWFYTDGDMTAMHIQIFGYRILPSQE